MMLIREAMMSDTASIYGVILAGGLATRMGGGDKCLLPLGGKPMLAHVIERLSSQVRGLVLNANDTDDAAAADRFADFELAVAPDSVPGHAGPLAGILTGMEWAAAHAPGCTHIATVAADTPFFPGDLVERLWAGLQDGAELVRALSDGKRHPTFGLWPVDLRDDLRHCLTAKRMRKIVLWTERHKTVEINFESGEYDPFFNVNTTQDLIAAERMLP